MSHNITDRDGLFVVREPAWHQLGTVLPDHPTREEAQQIAHNWEPITEPVYKAEPTIHPHVHKVTCQSDCEETEDFDVTYVEVDGFKGVTRSDNNETLGVVRDTYEPVQNAEMYEIAEAIEGEAKGSVRYETGGSLLGGRKVWLLVRLEEPLMIKGDPNGGVIPYYALQNAHDGSGAFRGQATMTRIVCDNTAQFADMDARARGTEFAFSHTKNVQSRIDEARAALVGWRENIERYQRMQEHLLTLTVTESARRAFVADFIPMPVGNVVSDRVKNNVTEAQGKFLDLFDSATLEGVGHTAYGLVAASIEYLNHTRRANTQETRFKRSYLDRSSLTTDAVKLAMEYAGA